MWNKKVVFSIRRVPFGVSSIIIGGLCLVSITDNAYASELEKALEEVTVAEPNQAPKEITVAEPNKALEEVTVAEPNQAPKEITVSESEKAPEEVTVPEPSEAREEVTVAEPSEAPKEITVSESEKAPEEVTVPEPIKAREQVTASESGKAPGQAVIPKSTEVLAHTNVTHYKMTSPQSNAFVQTKQIQDSNISHSFNDYNTIILNNHEIYTADIEGSTAVKGNVIQYGGFTYGASGTGAFNIIGDNKLKDNTPALLVGGNIYSDNPKSLIIESNGIVGNEDNKNLDKVQINKGIVKKLKPSDIDNIFNNLEKGVDHLIAENSNIVHGTGKSKDFKDYKEATYNGKNYLVINMTDSHTRIKDIYIPENLERYEKIIFSSEAERIDIDHGSIVFHHNIVDTGKPHNKVLKELSQKLQWHFPNAKHISISGYGLIGNMYAKHATVYASDGSLNGQLVANNLIQKGGFELHNFTPEAPKVIDVRFRPVDPKGHMIPNVTISSHAGHPGETVTPELPDIPGYIKPEAPTVVVPDKPGEPVDVVYTPEVPKDIDGGNTPVKPGDNFTPEDKVPNEPSHPDETVIPEVPKEVDVENKPTEPSDNFTPEDKVPNEPSHPDKTVIPEVPKEVDVENKPTEPSDNFTPEDHVPDQLKHPDHTVTPESPDISDNIKPVDPMVMLDKPSIPNKVVNIPDTPKNLEDHFKPLPLDSKGYVIPNVNISNQHTIQSESKISKLPDTGKTQPSKGILFGYLMSLLGALILFEKKHRKDSH